MDEALISLQNASVVVEGRTILENISLALRPGEIITVIGPNGAGKSTLLKLALGLTAPSGGTVVRRAASRIGYMPQRLHIDPNLPLTAQRFLQLGGAPLKAIRAALDEVGIGDIERHTLSSLSGGELQRVLLARALLRDPDLLVLDEPVQGVDIGGQTAMYELISNLRQRRRCGVLMVSHDLHWVMAQTDHVLCLNQHICCEGHPEHVGNDPAYRALFGAAASNIAPYRHHHNHAHDLHGTVHNQTAHSEFAAPENAEHTHHHD